jgi:polysaccharide pyruvyl transferase WcaK-like protein
MYLEGVCVVVKCDGQLRNLMRDGDFDDRDLADDEYTVTQLLNVTEEIHAVEQEVTRSNVSSGTARQIGGNIHQLFLQYLNRTSH